MKPLFISTECVKSTVARHSSYPYTPQLLALDACRPCVPVELPHALCEVTTPLCIQAWERELAHHPDQQLVAYILSGIKNGFRVGFNHGALALRIKGGNMLSTRQAPNVVENYLKEELELGRVVKLSSSEALKLGVHCSPFGVIPKKHKPGKWRLIIDLSAPEGSSVNDGIAKELCSLAYTSVDEVVACILKQGKGSLLAKMDLKQAYRNVPVHPQDRLLLGMEWQGDVFVDKALPFGLRSAPLIFSALADCLQWIMEQRGADNVFHYLDDFLTVGKGRSPQCSANLEVMKHTCADTGSPVEPEKLEGPATVIGFLGLELDTNEMVVRLPSDKLARLMEMLSAWRGKKACRKRELLSLVGVLSHASKAVRPGRAFLRRLIDLSMVVKHLDHYIRLNGSARSDIEWWFRFASKWNGTAMMTVVDRSNPVALITSDASGSWGCGAFYLSQWFQIAWGGPVAESSITVKELVPIVVAAAIWGKSWAGGTVLAKCDNAAVVAMINKGNCKEQECMHLLRCLSFIGAEFNFNLVATHVEGRENVLADALSRNNISLFCQLYPQAHATPTRIPPELLDLLVLSKPDWTSAAWTELWSTIFATV